jgi:hypothetical protein
MALLLGILAIHGVISYGASLRSRDRHPSAVSAQNCKLKWMFVRSALLLTSVGVVIDMGIATLIQWMVSLLFAVSPLDPVTCIKVLLTSEVNGQTLFPHQKLTL